MDFSLSPYIVFWEVTRACFYACRHCRAQAQPRRHPLELTTQEGFKLIDQIAELGTRCLVFSGGDPMMRPDIFELISYGNKKGLRVSLAPTTTELVTIEALKRAKEAGVARISISLDGSSPQIQDRFRGKAGSFVRTMEIIEDIRQLNIPFQINTTVSRYNLDDLPKLWELVLSLRPVLWDLFFLVPTGRGRVEDIISAEEHEEVFNWLYQLSLSSPFGIKTTCGHHFRRVMLQKRGVLPQEVAPDGIDRAYGVNDGKGCCFISHIGEIYPSGFLPIAAGNVRGESLIEIYRNSPLFKDLRDPNKLKGKCGCCEFKAICGGSRARAYGVFGDYLGPEPYCIYQPDGK